MLKKKKIMLTKGKHIVKEIEGVLCSVAEAGVTNERALFLKNVLTFNKLDVKMDEEPAKENAEKTFVIGVTDLVFNPMIQVYARNLKRPDGKGIVTPKFWNDMSETEIQPYFEYREKNANAINDDDFPSRNFMTY